MLRIMNFRRPVTDDTPLEMAAAQRLKLPVQSVEAVYIVRRAVDARRKTNISFVYTLHVLLTVPDGQVLRRLGGDKDVQPVEEGVAPDSFLVPQRAVTRNTKGEAVAMFLDKDGKAEQRVLSVIRSVGNNWLIGAGVRDGDRVIVEGTQHVRPGQMAAGIEVLVDDTTGEVRERLPRQRRAARPGAEP